MNGASMFIDLHQFREQVETKTTEAMCPAAIGIEKNIPIYDGAAVSDAIGPEWASIIGTGPGVFVVKRAFTEPGANDRIWNSLQKLCLRDPAVYARYMANPVIDIACRAWLGPGYQIATRSTKCVQAARRKRRTATTTSAS